MWPFLQILDDDDEILIVYHHGVTFQTFSHSDCWIYDNEIDVNINYERTLTMKQLSTILQPHNQFPRPH